MEFSIMPKSKYLKNASLETLHQLSQEYAQSVDFWKEELAFLDKLLKQHLVDLWHKEKKLEDILNHLDNLNEKCPKLHKTIQKHESHLKDLIENPFSHDAEAYRKEHQTIETQIGQFMQSFKSLKKQVFKAVEQAKK